MMGPVHPSRTATCMSCLATIDQSDERPGIELEFSGRVAGALAGNLYDVAPNPVRRFPYCRAGLAPSRSDESLLWHQRHSGTAPRPGGLSPTACALCVVRPCLVLWRTPTL